MNFSGIAGTIAADVIFLNVSGHEDLVWKGLAFAHKQVLAETKKPWGYPSIWNKSACAQYSSNKYR